MNKETIAVLVGIMATLVGGGTVFFHFVEGWPLIDAYFFTVVTLSTVGYGNLVAATVIGKIGTTVLIFAGLGVFAAVIQHVGNFTVSSRIAKRRKLREVEKSAKDK